MSLAYMVAGGVTWHLPVVRCLYSWNSRFDATEFMLVKAVFWT